MDPLTIAKIGTEVLPFVLSMFGGKREQVDPEATLRQLIQVFQEQLGPVGEQAARAAERQGAITGSASYQDTADSAGRIGGGSSGTTRAARALSRSSASNLASAGGAEARLRVAQAINQLATQALPAALQQEGREKPGSPWQNFLSGLAGVTAADGQNPFTGLLNQIFQDSEPGELPIDLGTIMDSPLFQKTVGQYNQGADFGTLNGRNPAGGLLIGRGGG